MRGSALVPLGVLLIGGALASGYALAAATARGSGSARSIPTITAGLPPPAGTPPSSVPQHSATSPGLGRTSPSVREARALLGRNRYVDRATDGQRLIIERADPWTGHGGSPIGVTVIVRVAGQVDGARWLPIVSHTDSRNQHLTSDPEGDVYDAKWVHLVLEHVTRFRADVDFRDRRVASFLPEIADTKPPYHLVDPAHLDADITATPPR